MRLFLSRTHVRIQRIATYDFFVGSDFYLGHIGTNQFVIITQIRLKNKISSLMVELEAEATYSCNFCGHGCAAVARSAEVGSRVRLGLRLCGRDGYLVVAAVLAGIVDSVRGLGLELAGDVELVGGRLGSRGVAALLPYVVVVLHIDVVAGLPEESAGSVVHRGATLGRAGHERGQILVIVVGICTGILIGHVFIGTGDKRQSQSAKSYQR